MRINYLLLHQRRENVILEIKEKRKRKLSRSQRHKDALSDIIILYNQQVKHNKKKRDQNLSTRFDKLMCCCFSKELLNKFLREKALELI